MNRLFKSILIGAASFALVGGLVVPAQLSRAEEGFTPIDNTVEEGFTPIDNVGDRREVEVPIRDFPERPVKPPVKPPVFTGNVKVIKFKDLNGNGKEDKDEARMSGVTFHLDPGTGSAKTAKTDGDGVIFWANVALGSHTVKEDVPSGFTVTTDNPQTVNVKPFLTAKAKFGNKPKKVTPAGVGNIQIIKFKDLNGDGKLNTGEPFMSGVTFSLSNGKSGVTNGNGHLEFKSLVPGSYTVTESVPSGFVVTTPNPVTVSIAANETKNLFFGNKPVTVPVVPPGPGPQPGPQPTQPSQPPIKALPPSGVEDVLFPGAAASLVTLFTMFKRQRKELIRLAKHLV
jgi:hypothetical protein